MVKEQIWEEFYAISEKLLISVISIDPSRIIEKL